ncbi:MAG: hypothetical protein HEQ23_16465 [Tepidisphaera sp.]
MTATPHASRSEAASLLARASGPVSAPVVPIRSASVWSAVRAGLASRQTRVRILLAGVVVMSLVDLDLTLVYARTTGMVEQNPIAREIMSTGSAWLLVAWKLFTVAVAVGLLYHARRHRAGELGSWLCIAVLCWLTARWLNYNEELQLLQCAATAEAVRMDPKFVLIEPKD